MTILIPIISEFQGKGFKEAQKQTSALDKGLKRLAVTLGTALSVRKITQFSKASVKAFVEEDKAIQALARNLENLGLAYDVRPIEAYIRELQYATGVADGELRPALQQLVTATKSLGTAQELLALSLDIAAGTGRSLGSVTQALSRAYLGTTTSLSRLNIGLSKADLTSKSFNDITEELTQRFSGQAARAAGTYAGQLAILSAAANDAQEILGEKLVKSLELLLDEDQGVPALAGAFEKMATDVGDISLGLASIGKQIKTIGGLIPGGGLDILAIPVIGPYLDFLRNRGRSESAKAQGKADAIARANAKEQGILRSKTLRTERNITKQKVEQNKQSKEANKLEKAGQTFNDDLISLEAAVKNEELSENEILRLKLKKTLILENADQAEKLAKKLADSQAQLAGLSQFKPANPFQSWLDAIDELNKRIAALGRVTAPTIEQGEAARQVIALGEATGNQAILDSGVNMLSDWINQGNDAALAALLESQRAGLEADISGAKVQEMASTVNVYVQGTGGLDDQTKKAIVDTIIDYSSIGYSTSGWYRTTGNIAL
jgi:hypothetical protein